MNSLCDWWIGAFPGGGRCVRIRDILSGPLITTNDNKTKHLLDNYYGTGQSCWDGIMRATSLFIAGKIAVCVGYGECGKGIALRAKGLGASVIVTEVDAFSALRATYDGFAVMPIIEAAEKASVALSETVILTRNCNVWDRIGVH